MPQEAAGEPVTEAGRLRLVVLEAALQEIVDQADYFQRKGSPESAIRWGTAVHEAIQSLRVMPHRGSPCLLLDSQLRGVRHIPVPGFDRYSVFYRVATDALSLTVVAVLHAARDVARILGTPRS
jgi:plasmid stabilization system protein ParE